MRFKILCIVASLGLHQLAFSTDSNNAKLPHASMLFGARETVQQIDISPDGKRIVYLSPDAGRGTMALIAELDGSVPPRAAMTSNGVFADLRWCKFVNAKRLICQIRGMQDDDGVLVPFSRLLAVDTDGRNVTTLGQEASRYDARIRQFDGKVLDWLSGDNDSVLMMRDYVPELRRFDSKIGRTTDGKGVDEINTRTLEVTRRESANKNASYFLTDGRGTVRIKAHEKKENHTGNLSGKTTFYYRLLGSKDWIPFSTWDDGGGMLPLHVDAEANRAYALKKVDGRLALFSVSLDAQLREELVYKNDKVDVDNVLKINRNGRSIGLTFAEEQRQAIYFDPKYSKIISTLSAALPQLPMIDIIESSRDENKLLIHAGSDSDPGRYYIYEVSSNALREVLLARPALENVKTSSMQIVSYPAADGTLIPAYLTFPPGKENAKNLPAIVVPHGGPSSRDEWGFDWLSQFLAYQGFVVIQPNFRGSSGYGDSWKQQNGFKGWKTSIGDVTDAAHWLIQKGIANPEKMAILGWSYGGYAALQANVVQANLFKAVVAIAPVTDLELVKSEAREYTSSSLVEREIGEGTHLKEGSPLQNAEKIQTPVLMFHGDRDINVGIQHSRKMDARLRMLNKASELVQFKELDHYLNDTSARIQMLNKIDSFLKSNLSLK